MKPRIHMMSVIAVQIKEKLGLKRAPLNFFTSQGLRIFDVDQVLALRKQDHDNHEMRSNFRNFISEPVMVPRYNISLAEERDLALRRLQRICDNKFISVLDFWHNPLRIFAAHELAAIIDPAMTTKMTVQVINLTIFVTQYLKFNLTS